MFNIIKIIIQNLIIFNNKKLETLGEVEYDQEKQTKYYTAIRWAINHLGANYRDAR